MKLLLILKKFSEVTLSFPFFYEKMEAQKLNKLFQVNSCQVATPEFKSGLCIHPENYNLTPYQTSPFSFQKLKKSTELNLTWSMSCWLTTVSPLLKSILASEAKESRDKRHTQTISAIYVYNTVEEPGNNEPRCHGKHGSTLRTLFQFSVHGSPREAFHWSRPGLESLSSVFPQGTQYILINDRGSLQQ